MTLNLFILKTIIFATRKNLRVRSLSSAPYFSHFIRVIAPTVRILGASRRTYYLNGNLGKKISVKWYCHFFGHRKQEWDWVVPFTKYQKIFRFLSTWSRALAIQTNGTENFGRFGKNGKKVIPRKVLLFFRKISTGMNQSIWILPGIFGFSIQMVSALVFRRTNSSLAQDLCKKFIWNVN